MGADQEVLSWLKTLPVAPEYHPTIQEFQDPISYIFKIEKEASKYGICKIVPPVPPQSKKSVISNFNRSIAERTSSSQPENPKSQPTFTTRQQQIGFCPRKQRPVQKSVWQSGEQYTLQEFEIKAKNFERNYLKNRAKKVVSALEMESLFWKANGDRPLRVEYANDMPGSAFGPVKERRWRDSGETGVGVGAGNVSETAWNMRRIARSNSSLLRFMKEDIPGVTSPMVYVAMMFSWFAWHVEDHDLHSLNYMHMGAGKTWYGVPRDAATAFEEVIRVHGFGEEINPLVTFAMLGEKTSIMSPEVLIGAGVPCCRLVQNAGDFVVTFPRAYHSGFSHGFNCGEASNIATPEWLRFAKDAAIRRASVNYPPMVSHFQLLYDLALALSSSNPSDGINAPRSSRLKDKKRGEGDNLVKQLFVQDITESNKLLHALGKGSAVVLLPQNPSERFICSNLQIGSRYHVKSSLSLNLSSLKEAVKSSKCLDSDDIQATNQADKRFKTYYSRKAKFSSMGQGIEAPTCSGSNVETRSEESSVVDGLCDRGLFSCVKCGIWPFACVALVQPTESTSRYLMSSDFNLDDLLDLGQLHDGCVAADAYNWERNCISGWTQKKPTDSQYDVDVQSTDEMETVDHRTNSIQYSGHEFEHVDDTCKTDSDAEMRKSSALGLLALTYGNSSDSDEDEIPPHGGTSRDGLRGSKCQYHHVASPCSHQEHTSEVTGNSSPATLNVEGDGIVSHRRSRSYKDREFSRVDSDDSDFGSPESADGFPSGSMINKHSKRPFKANNAEFAEIRNPGLPFSQRLDEDSSRMHVFCLEHAVELEQLLRPVGGIHIMLLCHSDYPKVEDAAKLVAEELEMDNYWNETPFRIATKEDEERIQLALQSEEETPTSRDWAVKLGSNLYYSSILCRSPLYSKQMPYNSVIYSAFGCNNATSLKEPSDYAKRSSRQRKIVMAGKWCGKVWMSNQVHPFLVKHDEVEEQTFADSLMAAKKILEKREIACKSGTSRPRTARKRKSKFEDNSIKKFKSQEREAVENESDDSVDVKSHPQHKKIIGKSLTGRRTIEKSRSPATEFGDAEDPVEELKKTSIKRRASSTRSIKKARSPVMESEDSGPEDPVEARFPDTDSGDSADVEPLQEHDKSAAKKRVSITRSIKRARTPIMETEDSGPDDPVEDVEHQPGPRRSIRSQRFKGQTNSRGACSRQVSDSENEMETPRDTRPRRRMLKPHDDDLETDAPAKKQAQKSKGKKAAGPKMRLPTGKPSITKGPKMRLPVKDSALRTSARKAASKKEAEKEIGSSPKPKAKRKGEEEYLCDIEGCTMSFKSDEDLSLHQRNICPVDGCYKKFFSHKYLVQHRRVHEDDRPLKCPWKGCKMTFKWAWARTEHIRVHTGARPYVCKETGCGQTFRFVSDFSRHKRKTGHSVRKKA